MGHWQTLPITLPLSEQHHKSKCCIHTLCALQLHFWPLCEHRARQASEQRQLEPEQTVVVECIRRPLTTHLDPRQVRACHYHGKHSHSFKSSHFLNFSLNVFCLFWLPVAINITFLTLTLNNQVPTMKKQGNVEQSEWPHITKMSSLILCQKWSKITTDTCFPSRLFSKADVAAGIVPHPHYCSL